MQCAYLGQSVPWLTTWLTLHSSPGPCSHLVKPPFPLYWDRGYGGGGGGEGACALVYGGEGHVHWAILRRQKWCDGVGYTH